MAEPVLLSWSSGKDSYLALEALHQADIRVAALVTLIRHDDRVSVQGVRRELVEEQARSLKLPLHVIEQGENDTYEAVVGSALREWKDQGISHVAYGDLFLEDIKTWRDAFHKKLGMECIYPIWKQDTTALANQVVASGIKTTLTCVDLARLDVSFAGRLFDVSLLKELPETVDPCGENGEFHTFVSDGPLFDYPIRFKKSDTMVRDFKDPGHSFSFGFCDLKPEN